MSVKLFAILIFITCVNVTMAQVKGNRRPKTKQQEMSESMFQKRLSDSLQKANLSSRRLYSDSLKKMDSLSKLKYSDSLRKIDSLSKLNFLETLSKVDSLNKQRIADTIRQTIASERKRVDSIKRAKDSLAKPRFYLSAGGIFGSSWSSVWVDTAYFSGSGQLTKREQSDARITGLRSWSITANWVVSDGLSQGTHIIYVEAGKQYMGFDSRYNKIDWQRGTSDPIGTIVHYKFNSLIAGFGYQYYTGSEGKMNLMLSTGVYYSLNTNYTATRADDGTAINTATDDYSIAKNRLGIRVGLGIIMGKESSIFRPFILPIYHWETTPVNRGQLSTRLHMWGINAGISIGFKSKKPGPNKDILISSNRQGMIVKL